MSTPGTTGHPKVHCSREGFCISRSLYVIFIISILSFLLTNGQLPKECLGKHREAQVQRKRRSSSCHLTLISTPPTSGSRRHSTDSLYSEPPSAHVPPPNSRLCLFFFIALIAASLPLIYLVTTSQLPTQTDVQQRLTHWIRGDEITIHRDLSTKQWGIRYTETLMLTQVHEGSQAKRDGAARFLSRKITHANGVSVSDAESFKVVASRVDDTLTLRFAPSQVCTRWVKISPKINKIAEGGVKNARNQNVMMGRW